MYLNCLAVPMSLSCSQVMRPLTRGSSGPSFSFSFSLTSFSADSPLPSSFSSSFSPVRDQRASTQGQALALELKG